MAVLGVRPAAIDRSANHGDVLRRATPAAVPRSAQRQSTAPVIKPTCSRFARGPGRFAFGDLCRTTNCSPPPRGEVAGGQDQCGDGIDDTPRRREQGANVKGQTAKDEGRAPLGRRGPKPATAEPQSRRDALRPRCPARVKLAG